MDARGQSHVFPPGEDSNVLLESSDGITFLVHSSFLKNRCGVFAATPGLGDSLDPITIDFPSEEVHTFLQYVYTNNLCDVKSVLTEPHFSKDEKVQAFYKRDRRRLYPCVIQQVNSDNTYNLVYIDGDVEIGSDSKHIRRYNCDADSEVYQYLKERVQRAMKLLRLSHQYDYRVLRNFTAKYFSNPATIMLFYHVKELANVLNTLHNGNMHDILRNIIPFVADEISTVGGIELKEFADGMSREVCLELLKGIAMNKVPR